MAEFEGKKFLLAVTGSVAAYKAAEVLRFLRKSGADVRVLLTKSAEEFIGKATFAALSNNVVMTELFPETPKAGLEHIDLALEMDAILVIPSTANIITKAAAGIADDLLSTVLSVCEQATLFAPAMNDRMWENPATIEAVEKLRDRGKFVLEPEHGQLASFHEGAGRLPEMTAIFNGIRKLFESPLPLDGKKVLVTAGPTQEAIDPVRFISNHSSGKMGYAIAATARNLGAKVTLISGPVSLAVPPGIDAIHVQSAWQMAKVLHDEASKNDILFMAAAVADYRPKQSFSSKMKRQSDTMQLELEANPDLLASLPKEGLCTVAFALETENGVLEAKRKMAAKGADFIVLNYANETGAGFHSDTNRVEIFSKDGSTTGLCKDRKDRIAKKMILWILERLKG